MGNSEDETALRRGVITVAEALYPPLALACGSAQRAWHVLTEVLKEARIDPRNQLWAEQSETLLQAAALRQAAQNCADRAESFPEWSGSFAAFVQSLSGDERLAWVSCHVLGMDTASACAALQWEHERLLAAIAQATTQAEAATAP